MFMVHTISGLLLETQPSYHHVDTQFPLNNNYGNKSSTTTTTPINVLPIADYPTPAYYIGYHGKQTWHTVANESTCILSNLINQSNNVTLVKSSSTSSPNVNSPHKQHSTTSVNPFLKSN